MRPLHLVAAVLFPFACLAAPPTTPAEIPAEFFFRPPMASAPRLNPAGTHVAMRGYSSETDSTGLLVYDIGTRDLLGMQGDESFDLSNFIWAGNDRLVFGVARDDHYSWGLYSVDRRTLRQVTQLNRFDAVDILGLRDRNPARVIVWVRSTAMNRGRQGDLLEINPAIADRGEFGHSIGDTGMNVVRRYPKPPGDGVRHWFRDPQGNVRFAIANRGGKVILQRFHEEGKWTIVPLNIEQDRPVSATGNPDVIIVARLNADGARELAPFDARTGTFGETFFRDAKYDLSGARIIFDRAGEIAGVRHSRQRVMTSWIDEKVQQLQVSLDAALPPGRDNHIIDRSEDEKRVLIVSASDRHPGTVYLFDADGAKLTELFALAPWMSESLLAPMQPIQFKARDGMPLEGYLTLPLQHDATKPCPTIVLPHGGPWVRDHWGYSPEAQFFASRGYAVFQPNYRGSTGFRPEISDAPRADFRRMHDDVTDGIQALVKAGIADRSRLAIVGGSFGGYLAVCGAAFEPDLYRCAVTIAGVFDWERVMSDARRWDPETYRHDFLKELLGNPRTEQDKFDSLSPLRAVNRVKIPVFVAHGRADRVADIGQSKLLVNALEDAGVEHEKLFQRDEAHGFAALDSRVQLFTSIERFLRKHL